MTKVRLHVFGACASRRSCHEPARRFLSSDKAERLRDIDAAIRQLTEQRLALIQSSRQMLRERNRLVAARLDAGEPAASLCAEFQLTRARVYEIAAKVRRKARRM